MTLTPTVTFTWSLFSEYSQYIYVNLTTIPEHKEHEKHHGKKNMEKLTDLLAVVLTLVLERDLLLMMESPWLTTPPLVVMEKVRRRYRSSDTRGLSACSGREHTRGRLCAATAIMY